MDSILSKDGFAYFVCFRCYRMGFAIQVRPGGEYLAPDGSLAAARRAA